jgi:hypothetical protein
MDSDTLNNSRALESAGENDKVKSHFHRESGFVLKESRAILILRKRTSFRKTLR